ncbi:MAG TPA: hypothetical protein DCK87_05100 [Desulfotomaculum sp.]|nr:hypothetical protein [Desulfotomaculum sp.]
MLIATETMLAMHCPACGKLEFHRLSRFTFSGRKVLRIYCSCGSLKVIIETRQKGLYWFQVPCITCENMHLHTVPGSWLWQEQQVTELFCPEVGIELGYIGPDALVSQMVAEDEEYLLSEIIAGLIEEKNFQVTKEDLPVIEQIEKVEVSKGKFVLSDNQANTQEPKKIRRKRK